MSAPNQALTVKVRDFTALEPTISTHGAPVRERRGFYSYIHHYEHRYPRAYGLFTAIAERPHGEVDVRNFGRGSPHGEVNDLPHHAAFSCNAPH